MLIPFALYLPQSQVGVAVGSAVLFSGSPSAFIYSGSGAGYSLSKAFGDYTSTGDVLWNNVVFDDKAARKCRLLLDRPAVICKAYLPDSSPEREQSLPPTYLLFAIADRDTNGDGYINSEDAVALYWSDLAGNGLTRLTPQDTQLAGVETDGNDSLYVRVLRKSDKQRNFTPDSESIILRIDLRHPAEGTPLLDEQVRARAYSIIKGK